jgi:hypothetical protein
MNKTLIMTITRTQEGFREAIGSTSEGNLQHGFDMGYAQGVQGSLALGYFEGIARFAHLFSSFTLVF